MGAESVQADHSAPIPLRAVLLLVPDQGAHDGQAPRAELPLLAALGDPEARQLDVQLCSFLAVKLLALLKLAGKPLDLLGRCETSGHRSRVAEAAGLGGAVEGGLFLWILEERAHLDGLLDGEFSQQLDLGLAAHVAGEAVQRVPELLLGLVLVAGGHALRVARKSFLGNPASGCLFGRILVWEGGVQVAEVTGGEPSFHRA